MRNLKKLLAVVVAVCMLATLSIPAFADTAATKTDAQLATDLGVLKGAGDGVTDAYLATTPNRLQGAIMFLRLLGLEDEALAFTGTDNFADVPATYAADSKAILAYLKAHPELGFEGVGGGNFAPAELMTAKQYYKIVLVALGFTYGTDFTWDTTLSFAAQHGLSKLIDDSSFTVADLATATIEGLKATVKDGSGTLVAKLAAADEDFAAKAIAAGLYTEPVVTPEVVSVEADSLTRVIVTFNEAIDEDTIDDGDFVVDSEDILADDVSLSDDGKVATLKVLNALTDPMENDEEISIAVSGVSDTAGTEIADYEGDFTPVDNDQPTLESIEFTGPQTVKLTFSEPIAEDTSAPDISIDGGTYSGEPDAGYDDGDEVTVDIGTELDEGDHTFKVKGFEDFAGYSNLVKTMTIAYASIDTAPTATVKEADQSTATLKFNRPVKGFDLEDYYQSYSNWHPLEIQDTDGNVIDPAKYYDEFVLVFTNAEMKTPATGDSADDDDRPLPVGTVKVVVKDGACEDRWGNEIDGDMILSATVVADDVKPEVTKVTVENEKEIRVYFSEGVIEADAKDEGNYTIKDSDGDVIKSTRWSVDSYDKDDDYATIKFKSALDTGKYTITIEAIADTSISENTLDTVTKEFEVTDSSTSGTIKAGFVPDGRILYVHYNEEMATTGTYSVLDPDNYRIDAIEKDDGDGVLETGEVAKASAELDSSVKISLFNSKIVKMVFPAKQVPNLAGNLTIGQVADKAGNKLGTLSTTVAIDPEAAPKVEAINKIEDNKYELELDQELKSIAAGAVEVYDGAWAAYKTATSIKFTNDGDDTVITITVPDTTGDAETLANNYNYVISIVGDIKSATGVAMTKQKYYNVAAGADKITTFTFNDDVAPEVLVDKNDDDMVYAYDTNNNDYVDQIRITYSEAISNYSLSKSTYAVSGYDIDHISAVGNVVTIYLDELDPADDEEDVDEEITVTQSGDIEDLAGNALESSTDSFDAISFTDYKAHLANRVAK